MNMVARIKRHSFVNDRAEARRVQYEREGREVLDQNISHEAHLSASNKGRWPVGAIWCFYTNQVWGPPKSKRYGE
jgi:hypothetical protein